MSLVDINKTIQQEFSLILSFITDHNYGSKGVDAPLPAADTPGLTAEASKERYEQLLASEKLDQHIENQLQAHKTQETQQEAKLDTILSSMEPLESSPASNEDKLERTLLKMIVEQHHTTQLVSTHTHKIDLLKQQIKNTLQKTTSIDESFVLSIDELTNKKET